MTTLFKPNDSRSRVTDELREDNSWVLKLGVPYRKWDGTAVAIIDGVPYKRYDAKIGKDGKRKVPPVGSIPCQDAPDPITGHFPHWTPLTDNKGDLRIRKAFNSQPDGTYEFCGPKVNGNPERLMEHELIPHNRELLDDLTDYSYGGIKRYLSQRDIEGIVFWEFGGSKKCKIRQKDFGQQRCAQ